MSLAQMSDHVQAKVRHTLADENTLLLALSLAHRGDKTQYNRNRSLAHYGALTIEKTETHNAIMESGRTLRCTKK
jgi:hypothetical protein